MPYLKTINFTIKNEAASEAVKVKINVNTKGQFYTNVDSELLESIKGAFDRKCYNPVAFKDKIQVTESSLDDLVTNIKQAYQNDFSPIITQEPMILYNIESHIAFAEDKEGNIFPNSGFEGAKWTMENNHDNDMYGSHYASNVSKGGYSITIGARAKMKTTYKYGTNEKVKYADYYKDGSLHGHDNPAQLLNSWCSFELPDNPKEIPYTDDGALFFHKLMTGMASLSQLIQNNTFNQQNLLKLILSGNNPLSLKAPE